VCRDAHEESKEAHRIVVAGDSLNLKAQRSAVRRGNDAMEANAFSSKRIGYRNVREVNEEERDMD
jgi:hypothetical protein